MEAEIRSRVYKVSTRAAADAMCQPFQRHLVLSLMGRAASISQLVSESSRSMSTVHYHVTKLLRLGLLKISESVPRPGRSICRYTAVADEILVPTELMHAPPGAVLESELQQLLDDIGDDPDGMLFFRDELAGMSMRAIYSRQPNARLVQDSWQILSLSLPEARELSSAIESLLQDFRFRRATVRRQRYLIRTAIVRRDADNLFHS